MKTLKNLLLFSLTILVTVSCKTRHPQSANDTVQSAEGASADESSSNASYSDPLLLENVSKLYLSGPSGFGSDYTAPSTQDAIQLSDIDHIVILTNSSSSALGLVDNNNTQAEEAVAITGAIAGGGLITLLGAVVGHKLMHSQSGADALKPTEGELNPKIDTEHNFKIERAVPPPKTPTDLKTPRTQNKLTQVLTVSDVSTKIDISVSEVDIATEKNINLVPKNPGKIVLVKNETQGNPLDTVENSAGSENLVISKLNSAGDLAVSAKTTHENVVVPNLKPLSPQDAKSQSESQPLPPPQNLQALAGPGENTLVKPASNVIPKGDTLSLDFHGQKFQYSNMGVNVFKGIQTYTINSLQDIVIQRGENSCFLLTKDTDALVQNIVDSPNKSIVRGPTEFRIAKQENGLTLIHAIDVRPWLETARVNDSLQNLRTYLPPATFRPDPIFPIKQKFIQGLGDYKLGLAEGNKGAIQIEGQQFTYNVEKKLGSGTYGEVYKVQVIDPNGMKFDLAIKQAKPDILNKISTEKDWLDLKNEVTFLDAMNRHPSGLQMYGAYPIGGNRYNIVMELVDGDWDSFNKNPINKDDLTRVIISTADGIAAMHSVNLVHYDLKPANLFFSKNTGKIGDFGFSKIVQPNVIPYAGSHGTVVPYDLWNLDGYNVPGDPFKVESFSFALSVLEARIGTSVWNEITGVFFCCRYKMPYHTWYFYNGDEIFARFESRLQAAKVPPAEYDLLKRMLSNDPNQRLTLAEFAQQERAIHNMQNI